MSVREECAPDALVVCALQDANQREGEVPPRGYSIRKARRELALLASVDDEGEVSCSSTCRTRSSGIESMSAFDIGALNALPKLWAIVTAS